MRCRVPNLASQTTHTLQMIAQTISLFWPESPALNIPSSIYYIINHYEKKKKIHGNISRNVQDFTPDDGLISQIYIRVSL
jgi:hypothetical protein